MEGHSAMLGTTLNYVALRLIGEGPDSGGDGGAMERGRNWILQRGGATYTTSWGKFWLTVGTLVFLLFITVNFHSLV
jgi:cycloartenol synthase